MLLRFLGAIAIAATCNAAQPVALRPYPQKFRTFYTLDNPRIPAAVKRAATPLPVGGITALATATDGAIWYGTPQGAVRIAPKAEPRDRTQYFAGKRYLPDDEVLQLAADNSSGMWIRTTTGVSHIEMRPMTLAAKAALFERRVRDPRW